MIKSLYDNLRRIFGLKSEPTIEVCPRPQYEYPTSGDQIKVLCTPISYIRAGERLLTQKLEEKRRLEGKL